MNTTVCKSSEDCKKFLAQQFPQLPAKAWRRLNKTKIGSTVIRKFSNGDQVANVWSDSVTGRNSVTLRQAHREEKPANSQQVPLKAALVAAAKPIKHCGDYGHLYYNVATRQVWLCLGDGDGGGDNGTTEIEECERLLHLPGVSSVVVEAEHSPDDEDPDWLFIAKVGTTIALE